MKKLSFLLCLFCISSLIFAKTIDNEQLYSLINYHFPNKTIHSTEKIGKNLLLVHFEGKGFALTANNDRLPAILAYSKVNKAYGKNPAFKAQCNYYNEQIDKNINQYPEKHLDWNFTQNPSFKKISLPSGVDPLITSSWNQSPHYNAKFPDFVLPGHSDETALVGCVAVVMGQIMNYYEHPAKGYGKRWYYSETTNTHMYANFDTSWYDFENMPDSLCNALDELTVALDQKEDVSKFLLECAISVEMEFQPGGSSSAYEDMIYALKSHFDYSPTMELKEKIDYTDTEWNTLLKTELDLNRPVPYRGQGDGGHAFILDGYKTDNGTKYHINWGWGGAFDGWFSLSYLQATSGYDFSDHQAGIFNIQTNTDDITRYLHTSFEGLEAGWVYDGGGFYADQNGYDLARNGERAYGFDGNEQWVISPKFQVPNHNNAMLSIWAHMLNIGRQCSVYISTSDTNRTSFTQLLGTIAPSNENWNDYYYSLRPYKNQNVYLGIFYNQTNGYITLDDIQVTRPKVLTSLENEVPENFDMIQAYPNPFNPISTISYRLSSGSTVKLNIFNINGRLIETLTNKYHEAGVYTINWNAASLPSGIYFCTLSTNGLIQESQKLLLVK